MSQRSPPAERVDGLSDVPLLTWECPLCGQSGMVVSNERGTDHAIESLLSHIRSSNDEDHGTLTSVPSRFEGESLVDYVEKVR